MRKNKLILLILFILLLAVGVITFLLRFNQEGFTGSRVKNPDSYLLDIKKMNGTDLHTLDLQAGDALKIQFKTKSGSLYMEINAPDGTTLYCGNGKETTDFTVNVTQGGVYSIVVEARHAKGRIQIQCVKTE